MLTNDIHKVQRHGCVRNKIIIKHVRVIVWKANLSMLFAHFHTVHDASAWRMRRWIVMNIPAENIEREKKGKSFRLFIRHHRVCKDAWHWKVATRLQR